MSAGQVPKLDGAAQGTAASAGGSAHEGGTLVLLQAEDGGFQQTQKCEKVPIQNYNFYNIL